MVDDTKPPSTVTAIGPSISCPGCLKLNARGGKTEGRHRSGHENWNQALIGAAQHRLHIPRSAFGVDQMLVVRELQDGIARADSEHRHQPYERAQGDSDAGRRDRQHAADQAERED